MRVLRGNDILINWSVFYDAGGVKTNVDFSNSTLSVFILDSYGKRAVEHTVSGNVISIHYGGEIQRLGTVAIDAYWQNNNTLVWSRAKKNEVVELVDNPESVTLDGIPTDISITTINTSSDTFFGGTYNANFSNYYTKEEIDNKIISDYNFLSNKPFVYDEETGKYTAIDAPINFVNNINIGNFVAGASGINFAADGSGEIGTLNVRDRLVVNGVEITGSGTGGLDVENMWNVLGSADDSDKQINVVHLTDALSGYLQTATFDDLFEKVNIGTLAAPKYAIKAKYDFYSVGEVSAFGAGNSGGSGGGGLIQTVYGINDLSATYSDANLTETFNAATIKKIYNDVVNLQNTHLSYSFNDITGLPTTLSGYGITDGVNTTVFNAFTSDFNTHINSDIHLTIAQKNILSHLQIVNGKLQADIDFYSIGEVSAFGAGTNSNSGSGLIQTVYGISGLGGTYSDSTLTETFNAAAIKKIYDGVVALQGGSLVNYSVTGTGNAITGVSKTGNSLNFVKGLSFSVTGHTHSFGDINGLPTTLSGYGITDGVTTTVFNTLANNFNTHVSSDAHLTTAQKNILAHLQIVDGKLQSDIDFYSTGEVSAFGAGSGGSSGGGLIQTVYGYSSLGSSFNNATLTDTFNAYTINQLHTRLSQVEVGAAVNVAVSGTGNAITGVTKNGNVLEFTKGVTFSLASHTHDYIPLSQKGTANGVASLDANGLIISAQLPSYVDDVIEVSAYANLPVSGESGKIYVTTDTNITYRWTGTTYVEISKSIALGETSSTAYRGDLGAIAYAHSQIAGGTGVHVSATERTNWNTAYTNSHTHANKSLLDAFSQSDNDVLNHLSIVDGKLKVDIDLYSLGEVSAFGAGSGGSGSGLIQTVYGLSDLGGTYSDATLTDTFNAYTINSLHNRINSLEAGSALNFTTTGTGNAVTSIAKSGNVVTVTKGLTFSVDGHTHSYLALSGGTLSGNLTAPTFIGALIGNADSATKVNKALTFTGYSTGTFDGSAVLSIAIPNNTNQLVNGAGYLKANQNITISGDASGSGATAITLTLTNSGVTAGTYNNSPTQVRPFTVDAKGRVTSIGSGVTITPAWSSITSKPTTLSGYGITDAYTKSQTDTLLALKLDVATFNDLFEKVNVGTELAPVYAIKAKYDFYSIGEVSAFGAGSSNNANGGLIQTVYGYDGLGNIYDNSILTNTFNAYTINKINTDLSVRINSLEAGSALNFSTTGSGNVVTSVTKSGTSVSIVKGLTAVLEGDSRLTNSRPNPYALTFSGYSTATYNGSAAVSVALPTKVSQLTNDSGYLTSIDADLVAIAALSGTSGLLRKTAANTWSLDTNAYLTAITKAQVEAVLTGNITTHTHSQYLTGNQTITVSGDATGSGTTSIALTLANSGVVAGTYNNSATQVRPFTVDSKGRVTSIGTAVTITPAWGSVTGKPTTIGGYGITDAYTKTQIDSFLALKLDASTFNDLFEKVNIGTTASPVYAIKAKYNFYSVGEVSAFGAGAGSGSSGLIKTVYGYSGLGGAYNNAALTDTFNAYTINKINTDLGARITSLEAGSALTFTTAGSGNAVTSVTKSGTSVTVTKGLTFSVNGHTHTFASLTNKPTTLSGYGITDAYTKTDADNTFLKLSGGTLTNGIEIQNALNGASYAYGGGGYNPYYNNIILRGSSSAGSSGILFTSSKGTTSINQVSDRAFIQYHPYGVTLSAEGSLPTIGTTGESGKLVIGVGNDADDMVYIQSPSTTGIKHIVGTSIYTMWDSGNFTNLNQLTTRNFNDLQNKPTTLGGYGITDGFKIQAVAAGNDIPLSGVQGGYWQNIGSYASFVQSGYNYGGQFKFGSGGVAQRYITNGSIYYSWRNLLDDNNYSNYALPLSGGTLSGNLSINAALLSTSSFLTLGQSDFNVVVNKGANSFYPNYTSGLVDLGFYNNRWRYLYTNYLCNSQNTPIHIDALWHSGNDGSGSGLDADTLDGVHYDDISYGKYLGAGSTSYYFFIPFYRYDAALDGSVVAGTFTTGRGSSKTGVGSNASNVIEVFSKNQIWQTGANDDRNYILLKSASGGGQESNIYFATAMYNGQLWYGLRISNFQDCGIYFKGYSSNTLTPIAYYKNYGGEAILNSEIHNSIKKVNPNSGISSPYYNYTKLALVTDNVESATRLKTARTIWGQSFNGEGNVSGDLSGVGGIYTSGYLYSNRSGVARTIIDYYDGGIPIFGCGTAGAGLDTYLDGNNIYLRTAGHTNNMMLTSTGNVLIGTTTDAGYKLDVNGKLRATGAVTLGSTLSVASTLSALSLKVTNSDAKSGMGLSLHGNPTSGKPDYGIMFAGTSTFGAHGNIHPNDWATYFTIYANGSNRGWIFQKGTVNVASISTAGDAKFDGTLNVVGATTLSSTLGVTGKVTLAGALSVGNTLTMDGESINSISPNTTGVWARGVHFSNYSAPSTTTGGVGAIGTGSVTDRVYFGAGTSPWNNKSLRITTTKADIDLPLYGTSLITASRFYTGYDSGETNSISCSNWFRSNGNSGWYNATYNGGIYMADATYVRVFNNKAFWVNNNIVATGEITAFGASDIRLKSNIKQIDSALDFLGKVKTYEFDWNEKAISLNPLKTKKGAGVIAQEMSLLDNNFVHSIYGDYLGVDYERFIPYLIGGVNEVADEVTILKKKVAELELEIKQLKK